MKARQVALLALLGLLAVYASEDLASAPEAPRELESFDAEGSVPADAHAEELSKDQIENLLGDSEESEEVQKSAHSENQRQLALAEAAAEVIAELEIPHLEVNYNHGFDMICRGCCCMMANNHHFAMRYPDHNKGKVIPNNKPAREERSHHHPTGFHHNGHRDIKGYSDKLHPHRHAKSKWMSLPLLINWRGEISRSKNEYHGHEQRGGKVHILNQHPGRTIVDKNDGSAPAGSQRAPKRSNWNIRQEKNGFRLQNGKNRPTREYKWGSIALTRRGWCQVYHNGVYYFKPGDVFWTGKRAVFMTQHGPFYLKVGTYLPTNLGIVIVTHSGIRVVKDGTILPSYHGGVYQVWHGALRKLKNGDILYTDKGIRYVKNNHLFIGKVGQHISMYGKTYKFLKGHYIILHLGHVHMQGRVCIGQSYNGIVRLVPGQYGLIAGKAWHNFGNRCGYSPINVGFSIMHGAVKVIGPEGKNRYYAPGSKMHVPNGWWLVLTNRLRYLGRNP